MPREFKLPDVGEGVAEGEIVQWLVAVGDEVSEDQPLAEVETDKALVEIPSPVDGTVTELHAEEGEVVPVGSVIVTFAVEGDADTGTQTAESAEIPGPEDDQSVEAEAGPTVAPPHVRRLARELEVDLETVAGSGPGGRITEGDVHAAAEGEAPDAAETGQAAGAEPAEAADAAQTAGAPTTPSDQATERERTLAAPATRRVAKELGVDLNAVPAVEERDGEAFVTEDAVRQFADSGGEAATAAGGAMAAPTGGETREPYRGLRRTIGDQMVTSKSEIPHVHSFETVEVSGLVETRERLKPIAEEQGINLTYMPIIMKALVAALEEFPALNAALDTESEELVYKHYYNIGIATHTDAGLMVPVVKNVGQKGLLQIASEVRELSQKARDRSIAREEMQDGTFTITNYGAIGGEFGTPIINHPEVAIMGVGRIEERPVVEDGEVVARPTLPLSIGIDHRVVDGGTEAAFKNRLKDFLREPQRLLLE